jgi:uncharacterized membrane protein
MAELMVVGFRQDVRRASEVLGLVRRANPEWTVDLRDAMAVYRDDHGRLLVDQSYRKTTREGAAWGGLFGAFLGALVVAPFTGGAASAGILALASAGGMAAGAKAGASEAESITGDFSIPEPFIRTVSTMIQRGDSAAVVLLRVVDPDRLARQFEVSAGTVLRTKIDAEQRSEVEAKLHGH